jgi:cell division protein FtsL
MTRLNMVLLLAVLLSALYLVHTQYESRRIFVEIEKAQTLARKIETERGRLEVEKRGQATSLRVEKLAKEQLQMRSATPAVTQYVKLAQAAVQPTTQASAAASSNERPRP